MVVGTKRVIAQHFDDPAVRNAPTRALNDHTFKFGLQSGQARKAAFNLGQLRLRDGIGCRARLIGSVRQTEKVPDSFQCEAEVAGMTDEGKPFHRLAAVEPLVARAALGLGKQADLLVVADRRNLHPSGLAQFSDGQHQFSLEAIVAREIKPANQ